MNYTKKEKRIKEYRITPAAYRRYRRMIERETKMRPLIMQLMLMIRKNKVKIKR